MLVNKFTKWAALASFLFANPLLAETFVPIFVGDIVTMIPVNVPPTAQDDKFVVDEQHVPETIVLDVLANDSDKSLETVTISITSPLSVDGHQLAVKGNQIEFVPKQGGFTGRDQFSYQLTDEKGALSGEAKVIIDVVEGNDPPIAANDYARIVEDSVWCNEDKASELKCRIRIPYLGNDFDEEGSTLTFVKFTGVSRDHGGSYNGYDFDAQTYRGLLKIVGNEIEYVAGPSLFNFSGNIDSFQYYVRDADGLESSAWVAISLQALPNEAPKVTFTSVNEGSRLPGNLPVTLELFASDDKQVAEVEVKRQDTQWLKTDVAGQGLYRLELGNLQPGEYTYYARAIDSDDEESDIQQVSFSVVDELPTAAPYWESALTTVGQATKLMWDKNQIAYCELPNASNSTLKVDPSGSYAIAQFYNTGIIGNAVVCYNEKGKNVGTFNLTIDVRKLSSPRNLRTNN